MIDIPPQVYTVQQSTISDPNEDQPLPCQSASNASLPDFCQRKLRPSLLLILGVHWSYKGSSPRSDMLEFGVQWGYSHAHDRDMHKNGKQKLKEVKKSTRH